MVLSEAIDDVIEDLREADGWLPANLPTDLLNVGNAARHVFKAWLVRFSVRHKHDRAARARSTSREGRLPADTVAEIHDAGLFRVLQPRRWGGYEMHPNVFYDVSQILGEGDMSVAWCYGVLACHAWQLALFDDRAAHEVWTDDTRALISSPSAAAWARYAAAGWRRAVR